MMGPIYEAINRKLASVSFTTIVDGVVESLDPFKVRLNDRLSIGLSFIDLSSLGIDDNSPSSALPFIVGEKIKMIRYNNGQRFYVLNKTSGTTDYNDLDNIPKLNTDNNSSLEVNNAELIKNIIQLHKISKTGMYPDLLNRPVLNTNNTESLDPKEDETINDVIKLHKVAKTGNINDLEGLDNLDYVKSSDKSVDDWITVTQEEFNDLINNNQIKDGQMYNVLDSGINAQTELPVGAGIIWWGTPESIPANYMAAEGQELDKNDYPALFKVIGYTYGGSGDKFKLPNIKGRVVIHPDGSTDFIKLGTTGGYKTHCHQYGIQYSSLYGSPYGNDNRTIRTYNGLNNSWSTLTRNGSSTETGNNGVQERYGSSFSCAQYQSINNTTDETSLQPYICGYYVIKVLEEVYTEDLRNIDRKTSNIGKSIRIQRNGQLTYTSSTTWKIVSLNEIGYDDTEGKITKNSNELIIGPGISKIVVNAKMATYNYSNPADYIFLGLFKNDTCIMRALTGFSQWAQLSLFGISLDVTAGDRIYMSVKEQTAGKTITIPDFKTFSDGTGCEVYLEAMIIK